MPPIPPIPPPIPPPGIIASSFLGISVIVTSAVVNSDATPAASCNDERTTLAGSIIPATVCKYDRNQTLWTYSNFD